MVVLLREASMPAMGQLILAILFTGFMTLAWLCPLPLTDKTKLYLDTTVTMGAILYFAPGIAILIVGTGTLLGESLRREPRDQAIFNSTQTMLQAAAGAGALLLLGRDTPQPLSSMPLEILAVGVAGTVVTIVNLLAVTMIIGLQTGAPLLEIAKRSMTAMSALAQAVQFSLGVIAGALARSAPWTVVLLLVPSAAVYWLLQHNVELRQRLATSVREREMTLAEIERIARFGSWEWQLATEAHQWSDEIYRLMGVRPDAITMTGPACVQFAHPADRCRLEAAVQQAVATGTPFDLEHRILRADGVERFVHTHGDVIADAAGQPLRLVGTVQDVTDRKALEAQLLQQVSQSLTARETEVLGLMARGNSNKEIASELGISEQTVKNHVTSIMRKMRVNDRTQAVVFAMRQGWIQVDVITGEQHQPGIA